MGMASDGLFPVQQTIAPGAIQDISDALSEDHLEKTARNRALIADFVALLYDQRNPRAAFEKYVHEDYIQHNPIIADGRENALKWLEPVFSKPDAEIQVRRVLIDGDYATIQIIGRMSPEDPGSAIINIFRLEDGIIVEHWDVTQAMPAQTASGRSLG